MRCARVGASAAAVVDFNGQFGPYKLSHGLDVARRVTDSLSNLAPTPLGRVTRR